MIALEINNPTIENYFKDSITIEKVLEFIAKNKININIDNENDLTNKIYLALKDVEKTLNGEKEEKLAKDFLNEL